jgi:hypothetical protein
LCVLLFEFVQDGKQAVSIYLRPTGWRVIEDRVSIAASVFREEQLHFERLPKAVD